MIRQTTSLLFLIQLLFWSLSVYSNTQDPLDISVKTTDGNTISLQKLVSNKPVYLKFWASWCQPCREQMPHLQHTFDKYGHNIDIIAVNIDINDSKEAVIETNKEFGLTLPVVMDYTAELSQKFDLIATPYHILLDKNRNIIFKGHDVSDDLNNMIKLLAEKNAPDLPVVQITKVNKKSLSINTETTKPAILFFSSAWCDWYLEKSRPKMSSNCINAQKTVNDLFRNYPNFNWSGILTRLWTGEKELNEYRKKYNIKHPISIDSGNDLFTSYSIKNFPTLIAIRNGKEAFRLQDFNDKKLISDMFKNLDEMK